MVICTFLKTMHVEFGIRWEWIQSIKFIVYNIDPFIFSYIWIVYFQAGYRV